MRARCGGGVVAWVAGVLAEPGTQGSWWLRQQEIERSSGVWQPVLANVLQYSCPENPPDKEDWQATVHRVAESWIWQKRPCMHRHKALLFFFFFACGSSAPMKVDYEGGKAASITGIRVVPSVQRHGLPPPQELWPYQNPFLSLLYW